MNNLIALARKNILDQITCKHKHITFILYKNKVVSSGYAQAFKTDPTAKKYGYRFESIHSELHAIKRFPYRPGRLADCQFVNIRFMADGSVGMAKPCQICQRMLASFGVKQKNIHYTNREGKWSNF